MTDRERLLLTPPFGSPMWPISLEATAGRGARGTHCAYCGMDLNTVDVIAESRWELDHIRPKVAFGHNRANPWTPERHRGGGCECECNADENLANTCHRCNTIKGNFDPIKKSPSRDREALVAAARDYIDAKRQAQTAKIEEMIAIIKRVSRPVYEGTGPEERVVLPEDQSSRP